jgi:DNA-directed RNA polymerase subunit beta'
MAAQSIGEPGTQLTMRTFHTGGVAGDDITHGLPRVVELFEARTPKGKAVMSEMKGTVRLVDDEDGRRLIVSDGKEEEVVYKISRKTKLRNAVPDGSEVDAGTQLTDGNLDPKEVLEIRGVRAAQQYLVDQVQEVYKSQGVEIHDKHIELVVRQMLRRVFVIAPNDSDFLPAALIDDQLFRDTNKELVTAGKAPAQGRPQLMGITKASLATDSWLSAASFQETTKVLTNAAIESRSDFMRGLKENVIIGKLIPAGTGAHQYQSLQPTLPGATTVESLGFLGEGGGRSDDGEEGLPENPAEWLASIGGSFSADKPEEPKEEEAEEE